MTDTLNAMRAELEGLVAETTRRPLTPGDFSRLIGLLNDLDTQQAAMCPECGPLPAPDTGIPPLVRAVQTCAGCPSQWDAWDATGQYYYLRFRSSHGTVTMAESAERYRTCGDPDVGIIASFVHGDGWCGVMGLEEFLAHAGVRWQPA